VVVAVGARRPPPRRLAVPPKRFPSP